MLSGNLAEFPLLGLIQTLMSASRGGALYIEHPRFPAHIYFRDGQIVHAEAGSLEGFEALELLAGLQNAPFRFEAEKETPTRSIQHNLETHTRLSELFDSWQRLSLPKDWSMLVRTRDMPMRLQLGQQELSVLSQIDNHSIAEVLMNKKVSPLETARILYRLLQEGLLEVHAMVNVKPEQLVILSLYGSGQGVAVLDYELYDAWRNQLGSNFYVRVRLKGGEVSFRVEPRSNLRGRLGLFERDMRQLKVARGTTAEVWPEVI